MPWQKLVDHLYCYPDTCNVYALVHEGRALIIDGGSGEALDHLGEIGVEGVDWVLYTHHHREQCQGHARYTAAGAKTAVPAAEAYLFSDPVSFWDELDANSVYSAVFVRPPREAVAVDRELQDLETLAWGPYEVGTYNTPGNSKGAVTYRAQVDGQWFIFPGDLLLEGGTLHTFYDNEWDYGHGIGPQTQANSVTILGSLLPGTVCPSHGPVMSDPQRQIRSFHRRWSRFIKDTYSRDWDWNDGIAGTPGWFSRPTHLAGVRKFNDHLYKFGPYGTNGYLLIGKTGRGLMIDCGGMDDEWLDGTLRRMQTDMGLKSVEVLIPTHVHGDHYMNYGILAEKWGTQVWCYENFADQLEHPLRHQPCCLILYYRLPVEAIPVARQLHDGEKLEWDGFPLKFHHLPGQTDFTVGIELKLDGKRILFNGDNQFYTGRRGGNGHEAVVARNGSQVDLQYLAGAKIQAKIKPDWILTGHSSEIEKPEGQIKSYLEWAKRLPEAMRQFSFFDPYALYLDPYWCVFEPWIQRVAPGEKGKVEIVVRNLYPEAREFWVAPKLPEGWSAQPALSRATLEPGESKRIRVKFQVPTDAPSRTHIISADLTAGDYRWGEFFDGRIDVVGKGEEPPHWYDRVK
ncbi:MAG TPA: MBL fold metallo-hydrolase [Armatimonadota bacterium]|jgi:glyoxylase-like metal-dependent hydrolase (beta-lactamase superfamily II)